MSIQLPRLVIAGAAGDTGKTIVSLALIAALKKRGLRVAPFKKGPDYIDAAWLSFAAGRACHNLDTYMVAEDLVCRTFRQSSADADCAVIEGNRGLFDGRDVEGTHSTAALAELLDTPLLLVVDCRKVTRTVAAMINGCRAFAPSLTFAGVVLNNVAGSRHVRIVTEAIERYCDLPVLGEIPAIRDEEIIPGRHLGLVTPAEFREQHHVREKLEEIADLYLDVDAILAEAQKAPGLAAQHESPHPVPEPDLRIGYFCDSAFSFYYPDNLDALRECGARLVPVSSLSDEALPDIDALYIGGGFPETHLDKLAANPPLMTSVREAIEAGLPVYAECGGLMYLARSISWKEERIELCGIFPLDLVMHDRPVGHGYVEMTADRDNPFFPKGSSMRGHEFHYSAPEKRVPAGDTCLKMTVGQRRDGLVYKNCFACYAHIHARGVADWAPAFAGRARQYKLKRQHAQSSEDMKKGNRLIRDRASVALP
jgi:cobyrinic acid a,c-diamide synthase